MELAKLRVGSGFGKLTFEEALVKSRPGDTLVIYPGKYDISEIYLVGIEVRGHGAPEDIELTGSIAVHSHCTFKNLTMRAMPYKNAIHVGSAQSMATMENCHVYGDPAGQCSTIWAAGPVVLNTVTSESDPDEAAVFIARSGTLRAADSNLQTLVANGSKLELTHCTTSLIRLDAGAQLKASETHYLDIVPGKRALVADKRSVVQLSNVKLGSPDVEIYLNNSIAEIANFEAHENDRLTVFVENNGRLTNCDPEIGIVDLDNQPLEPEPTSEPPVPALSDDLSGEEPDTLMPEFDDPLSELENLIGLATVKKQAQRFIDAVELRHRRAQFNLPTDSLDTLHCMFLGNPGTGKTTVARLIGKAMHDSGVVKHDVFIETGRSELVSEHIGGSAQKTRSVLEKGKGGVIFIDEAYSLASSTTDSHAKEALAELIAFMENNRTDTMVILAGYNAEMHKLLALNEGLRSRVKHQFHFEDYSVDEIVEIGLAELYDGHYEVDRELYRRIISTAYSQSPDRSNARWVRNFNEDLLARQGERVLRIEKPNKRDFTQILNEDLHALAGNMTDAGGQSVEAKLSQLDSLVGLGPVKEWVRSLVEQAQVNQRLIQLDANMERPNYHVTFTGNPGTGKTTVARLVAEIFHLLGILPTPTVSQYPATKLMGEFIGHSAANTHRAFDTAMGGVLFIDEAHQFANGNRTNGSFHKEIINAMITRLEDDRDKFVAIFAGYTSEMEKLFRTDPGLKSRIPNEIEFPDYTAQEVATIAASILSKNWEFDDELFKQITAVMYEELPESDRSNGRWARTFTEQVVRRHNSFLVQNEVADDQVRIIPDEVLLSFLNT